MDLVTITCDRDFYIMEAQSRSIQKFVAPCKHWVFVLESELPQEDWINLLTPYYTNHEIEFVFLPYTERADPSGWAIQQYWKLRAVDWVKDDFVILDSKNLFVKQTDVAQWKYEGPGVFGIVPEKVPEPGDHDYDPTTKGVMECINYYCDFYDIPFPKKFMTGTTPFLARKDVMEEMSRMVKEKNVFAVKVGWHLEFLLYSMIAVKYGVMDTLPAPAYRNATNAYSVLYHKTNWDINNAHLNGFEIISKDELCTCIGIHRSWIDFAPRNERLEMMEFLKSLDILTDRLRDRLDQDPIANSILEF